MNLELRIPWGYATSYKTLAEAKAILLVHYHPEYVRRLVAWLDSKGGTVGIGGTWRAGGAQPDKPGFAPEGKSFHQDQAYVDGFVGACAVDLVCPTGNSVHRAPTWVEVLPQGGTAAAAWGLHCNVSTEPWHMQPIEIDGWQSWWEGGRPAPRPDYPLPVTTPIPVPVPPLPPTVLLYRAQVGDSYWRIAEKVHADGKATSPRVQAIQVANGNRPLRPGDIVNIPGRVGAS